MKTKITIASLFLAASAFAAEKKAPEIILPATISLENKISAKNAYTSSVPVDLVKQCGTPAREVIIFPTIGLGFQVGESGYYSSNREEELPAVLKTAKTETTMKIAGISADFSRFFVDIKIKNSFLKGALSEEESSELITRYVAKVMSCDGEELRMGTDSHNVRDLIRDLSDNNFDEYLGCKLDLTVVSADKSFAPDPFNFEKLQRKYNGKSGSELINRFTLSIGPHGNATFTSDAAVSAQIMSNYPTRQSIFTLKAEKGESGPARERIIKAANDLAKEIMNYGDDLATNSGPEGSTAESTALQKVAFEDHREEMKANINEIRSQFSELNIQDQFLALTIIGRAYYYVDQIQARLKK